MSFNYNSPLDEFAQKFPTLLKKLCIFFYRKGLSNQAEDLASEVMSALFKKINAKHPIENIEAFAFGIAKHLAIDMYKKLQKAPESLEDIKAEYPQKGNSLDDVLIQKQYLQYVRKCADNLALSLNDRLIFFSDDLDKDDVLAEQIGLTVVNLRVKRFRIKTAMLKCVSKYLKPKT